MGKKPAVSLRVYKGPRMSFDENGKVQNENQRVVLTHDTQQWKNFLSALRANGYVKVEAEKIFYVESKKDSEGYFKDDITECPESLIEKIKQEVKEAFEQKAPDLTDDQKRIAELEETVKKITKDEKPKADKPKAEKPKTEDISDLRAEYEKLYGKKPYGGWKADMLKQKINDFK